MASIREQIMQAVVVALNNGNPAGVPDATRLRLATYEAAELPSISVAPLREDVAPIGGRRGPLVQRTLRIRVDCRAIGGDDVLDPLVAWAVKALVGSTLGGIAQDVQEASTDWQFEDLDAVYGLASVEFDVNYNTPPANLEVNT